MIYLINQIWKCANRMFIVSLLGFYILPGTSVAENLQGHAAWWIDHYGVADEQDVLVMRANRVFEKVRAAADKKGNRFPRLVIIKEEREPWAIAIKDGTVVLSYGALRICYQGNVSAEGDSRLAFILGHELAHLAKDDFWHMATFNVIRKNTLAGQSRTKLLTMLRSQSDAIGNRDALRLKELEADAYGIIYMTMAGYDPKTVVDEEGTNFIKEWVSQITGDVAYSDPTHLSPDLRAIFLQAEMRSVVSTLGFFQIGVRLYQLGRYEDAVLLLERFKERFPGREVFSNIGLTHYQLAMNVLSQCNRSLPFHFNLATLLDIQTSGLHLEGIRGDASSKTNKCFKNISFYKHIKKTIRYLEHASHLDPAYLPAKVNLTSALIMNQQYSKAISVADEALKLHPNHPDILNNRAIAIYLFGNRNNIDTADTALKSLQKIFINNPSYPRSLYNQARILSERKRNVSAREAWVSFLQHESTGIYAQSVRKKLNMAANTKNAIPVTSSWTSPIPLGNLESLSEYSKSLLRTMKVTEFDIGEFSGEIYEGEEMKLLVVENKIELVVSAVDPPVEYQAFQQKYGKAIRTVPNLLGNTLVYSNFSVDVRNDRIVNIVHYSADL